MSKKILVTGCAGFIGFHVASRLLQDGVEVVGIDDLNPYYDVNLKRRRLQLLQSHAPFHFYEASIENGSKMKEIFSSHQKWEGVIHLAAQAGVRYSLTHPEQYLASNLSGFLNVLEGCRNFSVPQLLYASSSSVYGLNAKPPFSVKNSVDHPTSFYAATKRANELMAHSYSYLYQLPTSGVRFFTVYGPWGRPDMALFHFTNKILNDEVIALYNYGKCERDFTYIDDVVDGILKIFSKSPKNQSLDQQNWRPSESSAPFSIYNLGNGKAVSMLDFVTCLEKNLGKKAKIELVDAKKEDLDFTLVDREEMKVQYDFQTKTSLEEGMSKFVDWYQNTYLKS